ncbi:hypothetical protein [Paenibacillus psychroresistens]|nr:hypothetical protein [Paenibacillus psychroresistens]
MKYSNTKLGKYKYLIQNEQLKPYLPDTYLATKENIRLIALTIGK